MVTPSSLMWISSLLKKLVGDGTIRDENGTDIFRLYLRSNSFREVQICPYPSLNIQYSISYPYPNT